MSGRCGSLKVNSLDAGLRDQSLRPVNVLCSWARHFTLKVSLLTQEHKWVPAKCQGSLVKSWGNSLVLEWHPIQGGEVYPLWLHTMESGISSPWVRHLAEVQTTALIKT